MEEKSQKIRNLKQQWLLAFCSGIIKKQRKENVKGVANWDSLFFAVLFDGSSFWQIYHSVISTGRSLLFSLTILPSYKIATLSFPLDVLRCSFWRFFHLTKLPLCHFYSRASHTFFFLSNSDFIIMSLILRPRSSVSSHYHEAVIFCQNSATNGCAPTRLSGT